MRCFSGIEDEEFIRGNVPMTKQEIRILTMAKAKIQPASIVFDIGAGTGTLSVEAARRAPEGHVYAIEKNIEGIELIQQNMKKFAVENFTVLQQEAPFGLEKLPACDVVLIGGSGGRLGAILDIVSAKLVVGGRIVLNCITIQTLADCLQYMRMHEQYVYDAIQVQINRLQRVGPYDMAKAINPIYIVTCTKVR